MPSDPNGLPHLIIQNLPVTQSAGAAGRDTAAHLLSGSARRPGSWSARKSNEFDYPSSTGNGSDVDTRYTRGAGLPLDSPARGSSGPGTRVT